MGEEGAATVQALLASCACPDRRPSVLAGLGALFIGATVSCAAPGRARPRIWQAPAAAAGLLALGARAGAVHGMVMAIELS